MSTPVLVGRVMSKGTRDAVPLARVTLQDGGFVESDADGRFTIEIPAGPVQVEVTASGHVKRVFKEKLSPGQRVEVLYRLEPTFLRPYETIVRGEVDRPSSPASRSAAPSCTKSRAPEDNRCAW